MSRIILIAGALTLAACGSQDTPAEQAETVENINVVTAKGNDVTAIDAATGDDANMAADVEFTLNDSGNLGNEVDNSANAE